jgi:hypothetical protein
MGPHGGGHMEGAGRGPDGAKRWGAHGEEGGIWGLDGGADGEGMQSLGPGRGVDGGPDGRGGYIH